MHMLPPIRSRAQLCPDIFFPSFTAEAAAATAAAVALVAAPLARASNAGAPAAAARAILGEPGWRPSIGRRQSTMPNIRHSSVPEPFIAPPRPLGPEADGPAAPEQAVSLRESPASNSGAGSSSSSSSSSSRHEPLTAEVASDSTAPPSTSPAAASALAGGSPVHTPPISPRPGLLGSSVGVSSAPNFSPLGAAVADPFAALVRPTAPSSQRRSPMPAGSLPREPVSPSPRAGSMGGSTRSLTSASFFSL
jgi:hypothetical protein